jgi:hypothetical protein
MTVHSASRINSFLSCSLKYKFQYVDKIKPDVVSPYLERGIRIHEKLETDNYTSEIAEDSKLLQNAMSILLKMNDSHDVITSPHDNELKLFGDVGGERFIGIIDRVWPSEGVLLDWKTGNLKCKGKYVYGERDYGIQTFIYSELYRQHSGKSIDHVYIAFLGNCELWVPKIGRYRIGTARFRDSCETAISKAICGIQDGDFRKNKTVLCKWCDFKELCSAYVED